MSCTNLDNYISSGQIQTNKNLGIGQIVFTKNRLNPFTIGLIKEISQDLDNILKTENKVIEKAGPIVGYRGWNMDYNKGTKDVALKPTNILFGEWNKGVNVAGCHVSAKAVSHSHEHSPVKKCSCGIYAYWEPAWSQVQGVVKGSIKAWGRVIPGEFGFRAEKAQIESLYWPYCFKCQRSYRNTLAHWYDHTKFYCKDHYLFSGYNSPVAVEELMSSLVNKYEMEIVKPIQF